MIYKKIGKKGAVSNEINRWFASYRRHFLIFFNVSLVTASRRWRQQFSSVLWNTRICQSTPFLSSRPTSWNEHTPPSWNNFFWKNGWNDNVLSLQWFLKQHMWGLVSMPIMNIITSDCRSVGVRWNVPQICVLCEVWCLKTRSGHAGPPTCQAQQKHFVLPLQVVFECGD